MGNSVRIVKLLNMNKLLLQLIAIVRPTIAGNQVIHQGTVITVAPIDLKIGSTVITPDGLGEVTNIVPNWIQRTPNWADVRLYRGYVKRFNVLHLQQYVIFHTPTQQFIRLSPNNYRYIYTNQQPVEYRVTNRLYAQLTDDVKEYYEYAKILNKQRGGTRFLRMLGNQNIKLTKKK